MSFSPGGKRKPSASPVASRTTSTNQVGSTMNGGEVGNGAGGASDGFTKVETKEERRKRKKVEKRRPQFQFDMAAFKSGKKVGMAHVRDLVLYMTADGRSPQWILVENNSQIAHTVVLFVPGLLPEHLGLPPISPVSILPFSTAPSTYPIAAGSSLPPNQVPALSKMFSYGLPTRAPGDQRRMFSALTTLTTSPIPDNIRAKKDQESKRLALAAQTDGSPPLMYLLTPNQMVDNDYRLPSYIDAAGSGDTPVIPGVDLDSLPEAIRNLLTRSRTEPIDFSEEEAMNGRSSVYPSKLTQGDDGWIETPEAIGPPPDGQYPLLSIDCEMVVTTHGQELARISIIDFETGTNIFDHLVEPSDTVLDYRTQWSGMTASRLAEATHSLASIQKALFDPASPIITPHTILLGHSLECDLAAIKLRHPLCIDTALIYRNPKGSAYKPGLKWLAQKWIGRAIQQASSGHDSEEDAMACVDLLKLKMANGPEFGIFTDNSEPIFDRIGRYKGPEKRQRTTAVCDPTNARTGYAARATEVVRCGSDEEIVDGILDQVESHDLVFARMLDLGSVQGWNGNAGHVDPLPLPYDPLPSADTNSSTPLSTALSKFNTQLERLNSSLPRNTALVLVTGHSDPVPMRLLNEKRQKWERLVKTLGGTDDIPKEDRWLAEDDRELEAVVNQAREGMAFFCVK